jgi:hypothetical protein
MGVPPGPLRAPDERSFDHPDFSTHASRLLGQPPAGAFAAFTDERNFYRLRPTATSHSVIAVHDSGGHRCVQVHMVRRRRVEIRSDIVDFVPGEKLVSIGEGPAASTRETVTFEREGPGTRVSIRQDVLLSRRAGRLVSALVSRSLSRQAGQVLTRLERLLATDATPR